MNPATAHVSLPDRYKATAHIANGGMAGVWAAEDQVLRRVVAVKLLAPQFVSDGSAKARFEREARAAAALSHPNVVTIYDVGEHDGRPFIVMEYYGGGTLADAMRRGPVAHDQALDWIAQAAAGLDAAHGQGVIHRDVKPANLLLDERGRLAVADFGIARLAWESAVTGTGQILGTAAYIAPEQAEGGRTTDASDRYALAVVAYELLTSVKPFAAGHFAAQARQHIETMPQPPSERAEGLSPAVDDVVLRGMAKDPAERWPTCSAFAEALREHVGAEPGERTERTSVMAAGADPAATPPARSARQPVYRPPRRPSDVPASEQADGGGRRLLWLAAIPAIALAIAAIALLSNGDDRRGGGASPATTSAGSARAQPRPRPAEKAPVTATTPAPAQPTAGSSSALNDQGYRLMQQGRYAEAVPVLQKAIENCPVSQTTPCAYAYYNLGRSLRLAGRPSEAIAVLETRLQNPNQSGTVEQELAAARAAAGQGNQAAPATSPGKKPGQGSKKNKGD